MHLIARSRTVLMLAVAALCGCGPDSTPTSPARCQYAVSPAQLTPCMRATQLTATVTTRAGCTWAAVPGASWMTIITGASGTGTGTISLRVADNWDAPRTAKLSVVGSPGGASAQVSQAGCYYAVTPPSFTFGASGGSASFMVMQQSDPNLCGGPTQDACLWTAESDSPWVTISSSMPRSGDQPVAFTVAANTTGAARSGAITVRDKVVRISQTL